MTILQVKMMRRQLAADEVSTHQSKLILDAAVVEQAIRFPIDLILLLNCNKPCLVALSRSSLLFNFRILTISLSHVRHGSDILSKVFD